MGQPVSEAAGLDAQAGYRTTDGDGLQLRHDQWHQSVGQGCVYEVLIRGHGLDLGGAQYRVDRDDLIQTRHVQARTAAPLARSKKVGGAFGESYRRSWGNRGVLTHQTLARLVMS